MLLTVSCDCVIDYHVTYAFQSEFTLYTCLNVKELLARIRCETWSLNDCNWTRAHNHLVRKRTLNDLANWPSVCLGTKWLWVQVQSHSSCYCFKSVSFTLVWIMRFLNKMQPTHVIRKYLAFSLQFYCRFNIKISCKRRSPFKIFSGF